MKNFLGNFGTCHVTVWTWNIPSIYLVYGIFVGIYQVYSRYMTSMYLVAGAVEEDMAPCRQSHWQSHHRALSLL